MTVTPELNLVNGKDNQQLCMEVIRMFETVPLGMTTFQIQKFVLGDLEFPTTDSKWWQSKLELWVRMQDILTMHHDHRKKTAKIKELKATIDELEFYNLNLYSLALNEQLKEIKKRLNDAKIEALQVEIDENEFALVCIKKGICDKLKEMKAFWELMVELEKDMQFSKTDKDEQEEDYWVKKAIRNPELVNRHPEVFQDKDEVTRLYKNIYRGKR